MTSPLGDVLAMYVANEDSGVVVGGDVLLGMSEPINITRQRLIESVQQEFDDRHRGERSDESKLLAAVEWLDLAQASRVELDNSPTKVVAAERSRSSFKTGKPLGEVDYKGLRSRFESFSVSASEESNSTDDDPDGSDPSSVEGIEAVPTSRPRKTLKRRRVPAAVTQGADATDLLPTSPSSTAPATASSLVLPLLSNGSSRLTSPIMVGNGKPAAACSG